MLRAYARVSPKKCRSNDIQFGSLSIIIITRMPVSLSIFAPLSFSAQCAQFSSLRRVPCLLHRDFTYAYSIPQHRSVSNFSKFSKRHQLFSCGCKSNSNACVTNIRCKSLANNQLFSTGRQSFRAETIMNVFDRRAKRLQRDRTTLLEDYEVYDYLKEEIGFRLADRICDVKRVFDVAVELGCGRGYVSRHVNQDMVKRIFQCEMSHKLLLQSKIPEDVPTQRVVADEEFFPFKENSLDLVVSSLSLHWVNDLPGCFKQVHNALKQDGVFLGTMFGGDTLYQLRGALQLAETEREGGFAAHISPFTEIRDLGNLLNRAGFSMLTIDVDELNISYPTMFELMTDLNGMGENNCAWSRKLHLHRDTTKAAAAIYKDMYGNDQGVPATFQILYFIGWKPSPNQGKVAERGSANVSFKDIDKLSQLVKEVGQAGGQSGSKSAQDKLNQFAEELQNKGNNPESSSK